MMLHFWWLLLIHCFCWINETNIGAVSEQLPEVLGEVAPCTCRCPAQIN
jgi:hypothetical protein